MLGGVFDGHGAGVDPGEVGGIAGFDGEAGAGVVDERDEGVAVGVEVGDELLAPGLAVLIGGFGGVVGEGVDFGEGVAAGSGEFAAEGVVRDNGDGEAEAGDVPGFAGGEEGDGAAGEVRREGEGRDVGGGDFVEDEVAVDFIGDEDEVVGVAEAGEGLDFVAVEDAA